MSERTVTVELSESAAQEVLKAVESDPDTTHWGEGNKTRNEATEALRGALSANVASYNDKVEAEQEPAEPEVEDDQEELDEAEVEAEAEQESEEAADEAAEEQVEESEDADEEVPLEPVDSDEDPDAGTNYDRN